MFLPYHIPGSLLQKGRSQIKRVHYLCAWQHSVLSIGCKSNAGITSHILHYHNLVHICQNPVLVGERLDLVQRYPAWPKLYEGSAIIISDRALLQLSAS